MEDVERYKRIYKEWLDVLPPNSERPTDATPTLATIVQSVREATGIRERDLVQIMATGTSNGYRKKIVQ